MATLDTACVDFGAVSGVVPLASVMQDFTPARAPQSLPQGEIHLWFFPQWENVPNAACSPPVLALIAAYLDRPIQTLRIERGEHGKPHACDADLEFNLSHAGNALLVGFARNTTLGVDIESTQRTTRPVLELARRFFHPAEAAALEGLADNLRQVAFLRLWCAKEAALKAQGRGIGSGLDSVEFVIDAAGGVAPAPANPWQTVALVPAPAYIGALAYAGPLRRVRGFIVRD